MEFSLLINKMAIFVVLMVIGYVCARRGVINEAYTKTTSKLVINVFMTATILKSVLEVETSIRLSDLFKSLLILCLTIVFCFLLSFVVTRLLHIERKRAPMFELLAAVGNTMFIGLPVAEALLGPLAVFYVSMSNIPFNAMIYTYGIWLLMGGGKDVKLRPRDILSVPLLATLAALVLFLLQPPVPAVVRELINAMSGATMPLSMVVIGSSLGSVSLADAFRNKKLYLVSFIRLILAPVLVALLANLLVSDPLLRLTCIIIAACPSAVIISVLAIQYGKDYVFTSEGILQSTALSMLTIPLILYFFA